MRWLILALVASVMIGLPRPELPRYRAVLLVSPGNAVSEARGASDRFQVGVDYSEWDGETGGSSSTAGNWDTSAVQWSNDGAHAAVLNPGRGRGGTATAITGHTVAGENHGHAAIWSGTPPRITDLNPAGSTFSTVYAAYGSDQVGYADTKSGEHAFLWKGTPESAKDLNPDGFESSQALGVWGTTQVGRGFKDGQERALLWNGSNRNYRELTPTGSVSSCATCACQDRQGGWAYYPGIGFHAVTWRGSAESVKDVHPAGYDESHIEAMNSEFAVGWVTLANGSRHAYVWITPTSGIDLQSSLDGIQALGEPLTSSEARGISPNGDVVGFATLKTRQWSRAVLWKRLR